MGFGSEGGNVDESKILMRTTMMMMMVIIMTILITTNNYHSYHFTAFLEKQKCCCPTPVPTCTAIDRCVCLRDQDSDVSCTDVGMAYCDPTVCGPGCEPCKCCCHKESK